MAENGEARNATGASLLAAQFPPLNVAACPGLADQANNPYTWLTHEPMLRLGARVSEFSFYRPPPADTRILHVHWPERIFWGRLSMLHPALSAIRARHMLAAMDAVRRRGGHVVWTAHNIMPHDHSGAARDAIWQEYFPAFRSRADLVISLSEWARKELIAGYPDLAGKRSAIIPHPHYRTAYRKPPAQAEARRACALPDEKFILLAIGSVRPDKGIVPLAEAFCQIARPGEMLVIAGACSDDGIRARLNELAAARQEAIRWREGRVDETVLPGLIAAADLCVFNFRSILNSGSVMLSLSFDTPVCAPELGSLKQLSADLGPRWFVPMPQPLTRDGLRDVIDQALTRLEPGQPREPAPLGVYEPDRIALRIYEEYAALALGSGGGA